MSDKSFGTSEDEFGSSVSLPNFSATEFQSSMQVETPTDSDIQQTMAAWQCRWVALRLITALLIVFAVLYPFAIGRVTSIESFSESLRLSTPKRVDALATLLNSTLTQLETIATFFVSLTEYPLSFKGDRRSVFHIIDWLVSVHQMVTPTPQHFFLYQDKVSYLQIDFHSAEEDSFDLYFADLSTPMVSIQKFPSTTDFRSWTITTPGELVDTLLRPGFLDNFGPQTATWVHAYPYVIPPEGTGTTVVIRGQTSLVGLSVTWQSLYDILVASSESDMDFSILSTDMGVIMDQRLGIITTPTMGGPGNYTFPAFSELDSEFWAELGDFLPSIRGQSVGDFVFYRRISLIAVRNVTTGLGVFGSIICSVALDDFLQTLYDQQNVIAFIEIGVLVVLVFFVRFADNIRRRWESSTEQDGVEQSEILTDVENCGPVGRALCILRTMQLRWPNSDVLNEAIDKIVDNLTQKPAQQYVARASARECQFCRFLVAGVSLRGFVVASHDPPAFGTWATFAPKVLNLPRAGPVGRHEAASLSRYLEADFAKAARRPDHFLARYFVSIVLERELLFPWCDPDALTKFAVDFVAEGKCRDSLLTYLTMRTFVWMIDGPFHGWLQSKVEVLGFLMAAYVTESVDPPANPVLCDPHSAFQEKWNGLLESILAVFPDLRESSSDFETWLENVRVTTFYLRDDQTMESLGQLRIRIESGEFTTQADRDDRLLFFSNLLKLCTFAPYFIRDLGKMNTAVKRLQERYCTPEECADPLFMALFHSSHAICVPKRLLSTFTLFRPLQELEQMLDRAIRYWDDLTASEDRSRSSRTTTSRQSRSHLHHRP
jgi:hypothetical protein